MAMRGEDRGGVESLGAFVWDFADCCGVRGG